MHFDVLGVAPEKQFMAFKEDTGTLADEKWRPLEWTMPEDESVPCWFLTNAAEEDRSKRPTLLCRPLICLRVELAQSRIATGAKLKAEWERRSAVNSAAVDVLHANAKLWATVHGPNPEDLFRPSAQALAEARRAADDLEAISLSQRRFPDGYDVFAKECIDAGRELRPLDWSAIHAEKYSVTPEVIYFELVKNAEALMRKEGGQKQKRNVI